MKSRRMGKTLRDEIYNNVAAAYAQKHPEPESPVDADDQCRQKIREWAWQKYLADTQDAYAALKEQPVLKHWVRTTQLFTVQPRDLSMGAVRVRFNGEEYGDTEFLCPQQGVYNVYEFSDSTAPELHAEVVALQRSASAMKHMHRAAVEQWEEETANALLPVRQMLDECTSTKQFVDRWPQGEQFVPKVDEPGDVPAATAQDLNSKLGL